MTMIELNPTPDAKVHAKYLRTAFGRKQAERRIMRLVRENACPRVVPFPVRGVGVVEGVTPRLRRPAVVVNLASGPPE